jgi:copper(I)-binding protein
MGPVTAGAWTLVLSLPLLAAPAQKAVVASEGWIQLPAAGETTARAFAVIDNPTMYDVYFVSAAADVAESVQFRQSGATGTAESAVKELTAPAYSKLELRPGAVHLLLSGLKRPLKAGETIPITMATETDAITLNALVKD